MSLALFKDNPTKQSRVVLVKLFHKSELKINPEMNGSGSFLAIHFTLMNGTTPKKVLVKFSTTKRHIAHKYFTLFREI